MASFERSYNMTKKSICILTPTHFSSNLGGAEYQLKLLVEALVNTDKYNIYYLCQSANNNYKPEGYEIKKIDNNRSFTSDLTFLNSLKIYYELQKIQPEIIYQNVGGFQTGIAAFYAKKYGVKFIWHVASDDDIIPQWKCNYKRRLSFAIERKMLNYGIKNSDIIAVQTKHQAYLLKKNFEIISKNLIPIGHPVPKNKIKKRNELTVLWIANIKPLKQPEKFVDLARMFLYQKDVKFIMIGAKGWGKWFKKIITDINSLPNLDYIGQLTQNKVNNLLSKSHLLVNTSLYEGFSNTFVQAWMREVPVVSLSVDPDNILVKERIGYRSNTINQLYKDVSLLLSDNYLREDMGKRASLYARENYSVKKMIDSAISLL
jgi:glycosyltransferase involved in cell wall biosynthesis